MATRPQKPKASSAKLGTKQKAALKGPTKAKTPVAKKPVAKKTAGGKKGGASKKAAASGG